MERTSFGNQVERDEGDCLGFRRVEERRMGSYELL